MIVFTLDEWRSVIDTNLWFKRSSVVVDPEDAKPYALALENMILANARLGRVPIVAKLTQKYVSMIGRLPRYESMIVGKLGIDADLMFIERARKAEFLAIRDAVSCASGDEASALIRLQDGIGRR